MNTKERDKRNLDPHKGAVAAMWLWGARYSKQGGGSMDFWDSLTPSERGLCRRLVQDIACARHEATTTSESGEPKYKADRTAEGRAINPESPDRSASSGGGLMTPNGLLNGG